MASPRVSNEHWLFQAGYDAYVVVKQGRLKRANEVEKVNELFLGRLRDMHSSESSFAAALEQAHKEKTLLIANPHDNDRTQATFIKPKLADEKVDEIIASLFYFSLRFQTQTGTHFNSNPHVKFSTVSDEEFAKLFANVKGELQKQPNLVGCCMIL